MTVYIVTRNRQKNIKRIVPLWLEQGMHVTLVVEGSEWQFHEEIANMMGWGDDQVTVISPSKVEAGIGNARAFAVWHAAKAGLRSIIMSDDDMRPTAEGDFSLLLKEAAEPGVLGVGAVRRLHDRFTNGAVSANSGVILCPGGWGMQLFGLNIATALEVGNFDPLLDCYGEDAELMRAGIARGMPWLVHCDVVCDAIGVRYEPGGLNSYAGSDTHRAERERACQQLIHDRWPAYVSAPPARMRVSWQKMLDDYQPGWRRLSAIHGGSWRDKSPQE